MASDIVQSQEELITKYQKIFEQLYSLTIMWKIEFEEYKDEIEDDRLVEYIDRMLRFLSNTMRDGVSLKIDSTN